ncbi:MAG: ATP-binding protein, partial [Pseudomonadota bacterium]
KCVQGQPFQYLFRYRLRPKEHSATLDDDIPEGRYVLLAVSDTGTGIEKADLERIFEPFYSTKDESIGTGLGLSSIQGFMAQSNGVVRVYSEVGVGTTFKLYFPALSGNDFVGQNAPPNQVAERRGGKLRVLFAEDEDEVRAAIQRLLEFAGNEVVACSSGDAAFATFENDQDFDLLVSDVVMPGKLQGPALAKEARKLKPSLAVIFLSGYASEATVHGNGLRPEDIRLMKPVRRGDLLAALDKVETLVHPNNPIN